MPPRCPPTWPVTVALIVLCGACSGSEHQVFEPVAVAAADASEDTLPPPDTGGAGAPAPVVDPRLDADVEFVWTETLPGQGTCAEGRYSGSFFCLMAGTVPLEGSLQLALQAKGESLILEVVEGSVSGYSNQYVPYQPTMSGLFSAGLAGELDCTRETFSGMTVDGFTLPAAGALPMEFNGFDATLEGRYDPTVLVIDGSWSMQTDFGQTCEGTFSVNWNPS